MASASIPPPTTKALALILVVVLRHNGFYLSALPPKHASASTQSTSISQPLNLIGHRLERRGMEVLMEMAQRQNRRCNHLVGAPNQVKCTSHSACSGKPVTVVITDECPGCVSEAVHFDLSGTSFGAMAISGQEGQLRNAGVLQIQHTRVPCSYPGMNVAFHVDAGSNPNYFAVIVEFEDGDGDLNGVDLQDASSKTSSTGDAWMSMQQSWGADWKLNSGSSLEGPLSLRLTSESGKRLVASNVIPHDWKPGQTYRSVVNF
ncbi:Expansin-B15 [Asimina triloba]